MAAIEEKARRDASFKAKMYNLALSENIFHCEIRGGVIISHLTDAALEAYYDHQ